MNAVRMKDPPGNRRGEHEPAGDLCDLIRCQRHLVGHQLSVILEAPQVAFASLFGDRDPEVAVLLQSDLELRGELAIELKRIPLGGKLQLIPRPEEQDRLSHYEAGPRGRRCRCGLAPVDHEHVVDARLQQVKRRGGSGDAGADDNHFTAVAHLCTFAVSGSLVPLAGREPTIGFLDKHRQARISSCPDRTMST
jgi:hypothetical protein